MTKVTDRNGVEWMLDITTPEIKAVRAALGVNLWDAFAGDYGVYSSVIGDPEKLVGVAYVLCEKQIVAKGMSPEDFGRSWQGDSLRELADRFTDEVVGFFPNATGREIVRATVAKMRELVELRTALLATAVRQLDPASMLVPLSDGSTNPVASAELHPETSHSAT